jgi:peptidoglycan/xylan/chitin deacetylase (PgdA/CDA1 family)
MNRNKIKLRELMAYFLYPILRIKNYLLSYFSNQNGRLIVILYHDVNTNQIDKFASQIDWLSNYWEFITPRQFELMSIGVLPIDKNYILLTFDDGFYSNGIVATKVLNPRNIKAIFFIVSEFVDIEHEVNARKFIAKNIYPRLSPMQVPLGQYNLNWNDLKDLLKKGHMIGGHTRTHCRLSEVSCNQNLRAEIIDSADEISKNLSIDVKHFAYTFGTLEDFSEDALTVASDRFDFVYSGLRGYNSKKTSNYAIRRHSVSPENSLPLLGFLLEGGADYRYKKSLKAIDSWANKLL